MVLPIIIGIVVIVLLILLFVVIAPFIKLLIFLFALGVVWKMLGKKIRKLSAWETALLFIVVLLSLAAIGAKIGVFSVASTPSTQNGVLDTSSLLVALSFINLVVTILYIKRR